MYIYGSAISAEWQANNFNMNIVLLNKVSDCRKDISIRSSD